MDEIVDQYRKIATSLGLDKKTENAFVLENINRITKEKRDDEQRVLELERNEKQKALEHERNEKQKEMERQEKERERTSQLELEKEKLRIEVLEREKAREVSEREKAREASERDKAREASERDKAREASDRERDRTQQFELEKLRLLNEQKRFEFETNTSRQESQTSLSETRNPSTRWNIDMPLLNAAAEVDVAAYLKRFEHLCETQNIPLEYWKSALSAKFETNTSRQESQTSLSE